MNCWTANYSVIVTWVSLGSSPHLPPSCSNSVTSLLPNSYPPWWFPMGLHLIQLSEHTRTICFEVFFLNHWHDSSPASLGKRAVAKFSHFPENTLVTFWIWNCPSGKTCGETSALPKQELGGERELRWTKPRVNEGREVGEARKAKLWKGGWSNEWASEDVPGHIYALFSLQWRLSLVGPTAERSLEREMRQTSQKRFAFLAFVLVGLLMKEQQTQNGEQKGSSADGGTITDILGTLNNLSAQTLKRLLSVTFVYKPPWKGRLTGPYPFIWVQMARGIHCVCES